MVASQAVGLGLSEAIRQAVPAWLVPAVIAVTRLGNVALLLAVFTLDYWFGDNRRGAHALSLALGGMAVVTGLKAIFAEPRPPVGAQRIAVGGYGFPSGHATTATIGYGVLAYDLRVGSRRLRYGVATVLVVLVALSRVVLGAHFLRDVVVGIAVGLVFLAAAESLTGHAPRPGFLVAAGLGVIAVLVSGASQDSMTELGAILGAALAWEAFDTIPAVETLRERLVLVVVGVPVVAAISYLSLFTDRDPLVVFVLNAALLAGVVLAPFAVTYLLGGDREATETAS